MKRIVLCCDGTWNSADKESEGVPCVTNVVKIAYRIAKSDGAISQIISYDQGVGTGNLYDRVTGGASGDGLEENIHDAYRFLIANYELGDEIFIFGFSRGAFTARSISGMIRKCGILTREHVEKYRDARLLYHSKETVDGPAAGSFRKQYSIVPDKDIEVKFIGVWDTVGALGIPVRGLRALQKDKYEFYDTELSASVKFAYHALAIDEQRAPFEPTLWDYEPKLGQTIEQVWFSGVHSDIGGGYKEVGLSDIALEWMLKKAEGAGLRLDAGAIAAKPLAKNPLQQPPHESRKGVYLLQPPLHRAVGIPSKNSKRAGDNGLDPTQSVHESVLERWDKIPTYRPEKLREYFKRKGDPRGTAA
jgi:uncharacterized protein (DUF2235 family)